MILKNTMKAMLGVMGLVQVASSTVAMDAEFIALNPMQAKVKGTLYKVQAANAYSDLASTDTKYLLEAKKQADLDAFITPVRAQLKIDLAAWIDTLLVGNTKFLSTHVAVGGGGQPADNTRNAFKTALNAYLDTITKVQVIAKDGAALSHPANLSLSTLVNVNDRTRTAIAGLIGDRIDLLLVGNTKFLSTDVAVGGGDQPADNTRDAFKAAILAQVSKY